MISGIMAFTAVCERLPKAEASITMANSAYTRPRSPLTNFRIVASFASVPSPSLQV